MNLSVAHRGEWICWLLRSYSRRGFRGFDSNILLCLNIFLSESDDGAGEGRTVTSKVTTADHKLNNRGSMITKNCIYIDIYIYSNLNIRRGKYHMINVVNIFEANVGPITRLPDCHQGSLLLQHCSTAGGVVLRLLGWRNFAQLNICSVFIIWKICLLGANRSSG